MSRIAALSVCIGVLWVAGLPRLMGLGVIEVTATPDSMHIKGVAPAGSSWLIERPSWDTHTTPVSPVPLQTFTTASGFDLTVPRWAGGRDRLYRAFQLVSVEGENAAAPGSGQLIRTVGARRYPGVLRGVSADTSPFPEARSKKGLQVQMVDDALALGIRHAALNLNLSGLVALEPGPGTEPWKSQGRTYHFHKGYLASMDGQVKPLSDAGVVVSLILLTYRSGNPALDALLLHPSYDRACPNSLGAFNTVTPEGTDLFIACMEFLAHRYTQPRHPMGRVANFILGNEVNSHWFWSNRGRCTLEEFAEDYLKVMRLATLAVRKASSSARTYVSLEHHWNIRYPGGDEKQAFAARPFLDYFHRRAVEEGDFDWHVAFHPYPENLFKPRTWLDPSATFEPDTPRITFKNLEILTRYLGERSRQFDAPSGATESFRVRRVILSEQGFHADPTEEGAVHQAAAYAYAYRKVEDNAGIDSFILHRHVDHAHEGGLNLGLWTRKPKSVAEPDRPRPIYEVFKAADGPDWQMAFEFALPVIGITNWSQLRR